MKILAALLVFVRPLALESAQAPKKVLVVITASADDRVGMSVLYHFKEAIATSSRYTLESSPVGTGIPPVIFVQFVSVNTDESQRVSAISVIAQKPHPESKCLVLFHHEVHASGENRSEAVGKGILASIDADYSK